MRRRDFIKAAMVAAASTGALSLASCVTVRKGVAWPIGCFNRPWVDVKAGHTMEMALDGIKAAGYTRLGLLTSFKDNPLADFGVTPEYLAQLKQQIADRDLKVVMAALRCKPSLPFDEARRQVRAEVDNAKFLGADFLLTFGVDDEKDYENYYRLMADAAAYSQERGLKLVLKPHGGGSGAAEEIIRCMAKVNHPNFKIWYDAGNIIYYTGKDPIEQLKPIVEHVTGFCAKDCAGVKGEIWMDFGKGKVDFPAVFALLNQAGFNGPMMVECCDKGKSVEQTTAGAKRNREYLEKLFAEL